MGMHGRNVIYTDVPVITDDNVMKILSSAVDFHRQNRNDIQKLWDYYTGKQDILDREKTVRPEINNKLVVNYANQIVSFKVGYLMGEPVQYVNRKDNEKLDEVGRLNDWVFSENKEALDKELADWFSICGVGYRLVLPNSGNDESPFKLYTLDPRDTFVVRYSGIDKRVLMGVIVNKDEDGNTVYSCYTTDKYYEIVESGVTGVSGVCSFRRNEHHSIGAVPIIEYRANPALMGEFEVVITLLNALNEIESDRADGLDAFVQALMVFKGVDIEDEDYKALRAEGAIKVPIDGDVKYLINELNQAETQTLVDSTYQEILTICGMPSQSDGRTSDSSNNGAVILRNGWEAAEARAKDTESMFRRSETEFLKIALHICETLHPEFSLGVSDITVRFTRRNYENIQVKAQVLTQMLSSDKIAPQLAFEYCGMFSDANLAWMMSKEYAEEQEQKTAQMLSEYSAQTADAARNEAEASVAE